MKIKTQVFASLLIVVLAIVPLIPGVIDGVIYHYFRFLNGDVIKFDMQCYVVPDRWIISSVENRNNRITYNLLSKVDGEYIFSSVSRGEETILVRMEKLIKAKEHSFNIYEWPSLPTENSLYWSFIFKYNLIVMGKSVNIVKNLSLSMHPTDC